MLTSLAISLEALTEVFPLLLSSNNSCDVDLMAVGVLGERGPWLSPTDTGELGGGTSSVVEGTTSLTWWGTLLGATRERRERGEEGKEEGGGGEGGGGREGGGRGEGREGGREGGGRRRGGRGRKGRRRERGGEGGGKGRRRREGEEGGERKGKSE